MKAFLTNYDTYCLLCGKPSTEVHHLLSGVARRRIADADNIVCSLCRDCHEEIHHNPVTNNLSKAFGQLVYELNYVADKEQILNARTEFRKKYGKSYL